MTTMKIFALIFCTSLAFGSGSGSSAAAKSKKSSAKGTKSALTKVQAKYKNVQTLTANFSQKQTNAALGTEKVTKGTIKIKRPDSFRWETVEPEKDKSLLVGNGKQVWFYTPPFREGERGQVIVRKAADVQSRLAIDLLAGQADVKKDFKSKELKPGQFELIPIKPAGDVERIELFVERPTNLVYKLVLFNMTGNQTELTLSNVTTGEKLSNDSFNFVPPKNTEEIK